MPAVESIATRPASAVQGQQSAVTISGVSKHFGNQVQALEDIDLSIRSGEFVAVVGPSGCGKSTLLRLVAGLLPPSAGTVTVRGTSVVGPRQDVGMMFQRPTLLPWRTSHENVLLPVTLARRVTDDDRDMAMSLLATVSLTGFEQAYPAHLSGGMQQRVALARLLMLGVDTFLLDEPFGAVDEFTREHLNEQLLTIHAETGATMMLVTHNIVESILLADRVVAMSPRPGKIAEIIDVPFARPRSLDILGDPAFQDTVLRVRAAFKLHGRPA